MVHINWLSKEISDQRLEDFYKGLQRDILDAAQNETQQKVNKSDIWEIVIREGLYQNLVENPSVAIGFLLITTHGPTNEYKKRIELANNHNDVVVLVGLSALVNDTNQRKRVYLNYTRHKMSKYAAGDIKQLDHLDKLEYINKLQREVEQDIPRLDFLIAKADRSKDNTGLYDFPLIDLMNIDEEIKFFFKTHSLGYSVDDKNIMVEPSGSGGSYHVITNKRVLSAVGRENDSDMVLSIPISSIEEVKVHKGWTKDRIKLYTKSKHDDGPYNIWVEYIQKHYNESDILAHLEG